MTVLTNKGGFEVNIFSVLAAVGMLVLAGCCGVALGILEKHIMEDDRSSRNE